MISEQAEIKRLYDLLPAGALSSNSEERRIAVKIDARLKISGSDQV
jgi:hypothetical protein